MLRSHVPKEWASLALASQAQVVVLEMAVEWVWEEANPLGRVDDDGQRQSSEAHFQHPTLALGDRRPLFGRL